MKSYRFVLTPVPLDQAHDLVVTETNNALLVVTQLAPEGRQPHISAAIIPLGNHSGGPTRNLTRDHLAV